MSDKSSGPLSGLLIADFTAFESGPLCTMLMADHGARVIKIEPPAGDGTRAVGCNHATHPDLFEETVTDIFQQLNRGKESVVLNLKDPNDSALAKKLVAKADVVVENFRPGVMARLGLCYDDVCASNPKVVYVSISGYGQFGEFSKNPAFDVVVQATSGFMSVTGISGGQPTKAGASLADATTAIYAYSATITALYGREKTGKGCHVDVAMQDSMMMSQCDQLSGSFITGKAPGLAGNELAQFHPFGVFPCKDNTQLALCIGSPHQFVVMATAIGHPEWAEDERFEFPVAIATTHRDDFNAVFLAALATKTAKEWKEVFDQAGLPANILYDYIELEKSEFLQDRKIVADFKGMKVIGNPLKLSVYPDPADNLREAPTLGKQTDTIRKEFS